MSGRLSSRAHALGRWLCLGLGLSLAGCVAKDAGYQDVRSAVDARLGKDVRWFHQEGAGEAARQVRELVKRPLDDESAVKVALLNNPRLQAEFERIGMARADLVAAWKFPNPQIAADFIYFGEPSDPEIGLDATISLTRLISMPSRVGAAGESLERAKLEVVAQVVDLSFEVRRALVRYQRALAVRGLMRKRVAAANTSFTAAERIYAAGNLTELEVATERAAYAEARLLLADAEERERTSKLELGALLGFWQRGSDFRVASELPALPEGSRFERETPEQLVKAALGASLDLAILRRRYAEHARRGNAAALAGALPEVRAGVGAERGDEGWGFGPAVHLELPLFDQGQGQALREESGQRSARRGSATVAAQVRLSAALAHRDLKAARGRARFYEQELLPLRRRITQDTLLEYNAMSAGVFQLMEARRAELVAEEQSIDARARYWLAHLALQQLRAGRMSRGEAMSKADAGSPASAPGAATGGH